jgi:hypothetical protein
MKTSRFSEQQIALAKAAMAVLGKCRVIRHIIVEIESAEPAIGQVQCNLLA